MQLPRLVKSWLGIGRGAQEGTWAGPFFGQGELGGWYPIESNGDGWQRGLNVNTNDARTVGPVYACVMLKARAASQCETKQLRRAPDGTYKQVEDSPTARVLRIPNAYETWHQLLFNTVAEMLFGGECLWLGLQDDAYRIKAVHRIPRGSWSLHIDPESKEVFYGISDTPLARAPSYLVPAREVCHFRMHTPRHPLIGESPVTAAALAVGLNVALNRSQLMFFSQMNRPSGVLSTDQVLTKDQIKQLREAFNEQSKLLAQGGMPILAGGLQFKPMGVAQNDAQLIEQQKLSTTDIARVFGVPVALINDTSGPQGGTEAMISHWLSIGLGSLLESIERSLDRFFDLPVGERIELDPTPLLRIDFAHRIDGLTKAVQGGILTPNEARAKEGFGTVEGGDSAYMQRQMTAMSQLEALNEAELAAKLTPPPAPTPAAEPQDTAELDDATAKAINTLAERLEHFMLADQRAAEIATLKAELASVSATVKALQDMPAAEPLKPDHTEICDPPKTADPDVSKALVVSMVTYKRKAA